jgi:hypothetical protein
MSVRCLIVDLFTIIVVGGLGAFIGALLLLGWLYPGSGADVLDWKPTRSAELEAQNDADDVAQMIEAQNERRRRTGRPERSEAQVRAELADAEADWRRRG